MKKPVIIAISCVVALGAIIATLCAIIGDKDEYVPSDKFADAYSALDAACEKSKDAEGNKAEHYVDLEQTIRIIHSFDISSINI